VRKALQLGDGYAKCRQNHDVVRAEGFVGFARVAQKADTLRAELIVDMRVVDDFARQVDRVVWKATARLVGVVDGAIDAVAEAELPCEVHREPTRLVPVTRVLDLLNQKAVVTLRENARNFVFEIEALAKNNWRH
jgi:hypothetical protein